MKTHEPAVDIDLFVLLWALGSINVFYPGKGSGVIGDQVCYWERLHLKP